MLIDDLLLEGIVYGGRSVLRGRSRHSGKDEREG